MRISLIGGSGFIGTRLVKKLLSSGYCVKILDIKQSQSYPELWSWVDVRDKKSLINAIKNSSVIYNLAAVHRDDVRPRSLYDEVNVQGARNVCNVAEELEVNKIIFTSSVAVYGFAPIRTDETGEINYFNEYGRTKYEAELIYKEWFNKDSKNRTLVIVRPTVVFGEGNRGNVYNLLNQIASGRFVMVGSGKNIKSMAYVENVAAFLEHCLSLGKGFHLYNYVDKPDFDMDILVKTVYKILGKKSEIKFRLPYWLGLNVGKVFDLVAYLTGKNFPVSSIRIEKFCSNTCFSTTLNETGFKAPVNLFDGLLKTIRYEFIEKRKGEVFYTE